MDLGSYEKWYAYSRARDQMLDATDTQESPWFVLRSDDKKRARLNGIAHIQITVSNFERCVPFYERLFDVCTVMMETIHRVPQPVIAKVHAMATAAGCQLVASCDLVVAAEEARFATPGVKIGLFCSTPMVAVSRNIGRKRALEMLLTGRPIDAGTAADWGLINRVVPAGQLDSTALELANEIAASSPLTLRIGKRAFYEQIEVGQDEAYRRMSQTMAENAMTCDAQEGMSAFLQKREPTWTGT